MEENNSLWSKKQEDLTVSDQVKVAVLVPVIVTAAWVVPLIVWSKIDDVRTARKLKKQEKLANVEDTTDEE